MYSQLPADSKHKAPQHIFKLSSTMFGAHFYFSTACLMNKEVFTWKEYNFGKATFRTPGTRIEALWIL
jgi:hypothetical protein